jgi:hypothetical protein
VLPTNHLKRLLFSFQRPGAASTSIEADREDNNIGRACQHQIFCRCAFSFAALPSILGNERRLYPTTIRVSSAFFRALRRPESMGNGGGMY